MNDNMKYTAGRSNSRLADSLRQMLAVLKNERQALATMDLDSLMSCANAKQTLCDHLDGSGPAALDAECEGLLVSARELNEINRRVRNLLAVNVAQRLDALTGAAGLYSAKQNRHLVSRRMA